MRVAHIAIGGLCMLDLTSGFVFPAPAVSTCRRARMSSSRLRAANDVKVTVEGVVRTVALEEGVSILDGLEAHDIDAPHSCRSGLCTEEHQGTPGNTEQGVQPWLQPILTMSS
ncbi:unnamed protein product [Ectocarpus sp. CCAP 1310/34]|nr:unnamed protein product [Ectocarpus sp. CCAP 1310/34]